jgi:hypothetical protein
MPVTLRLAAICAIGLATVCPARANYRPAVAAEQKQKKESFGEKWLRQQWEVARERAIGKLLWRLKCEQISWEQFPWAWEDLPYPPADGPTKPDADR